MKIPRPAVIDFETKPFGSRPEYPPEPTGVSIKLPQQRKSTYYSWGHPTGNNCTKAIAQRALKQAWHSADGILGQNTKYDYEVGLAHMGMKPLAWDKIHDTLFPLFLLHPHELNLSLKPMANKLLGIPPEERDAVRDWLVQHKIMRANQKKIGEFIHRAPGDVVGPYADGDVIRTDKLFQYAYPKIVKDGMLAAYDRERQLMPILLRNEQEGICIDVRKLRTDVKLYEEALVAADAWLRKRLKVKDLNVDSNDEVADALDRAGLVRPEDWTITPGGKRSTSKDNLTPDMIRDKRVATAYGYRNRLSTCLGTFMRPWLIMGERDGRIHTNWNQVRDSDRGKGARTGRLSSNPNLQNIPKDWYDKADGYVHPTHVALPELPMLRRYVIPDDGGIYVRRDYNQQEFRIAAHFEDGKLMEAYRENPNLDMHNFVRDEIHRLTGREFERRPVKIINFGMLYGEGVGSLAERIPCEVSEAKALRAAQRRALPGVKALDDGIKDGARAGEPIRTLGGRLYYCEEPVQINGRTMTFEYKLLNYLCQGSAADMTKQAIINYDSLRKDSRFLVTVHDEIGISAPKGCYKRESELLAQAMADFPIDVPLLSDASYGRNWASAK